MEPPIAVTGYAESLANRSQFVDYKDTAKSYGTARQPVGLDIVLGALASAPSGIPLHQQRILDAGCGTGIYLKEIAPRVESFAAIDFSAAMLEECQATTEDASIMGGQYNTGSILDMSLYEDNSFDGVLINQVVQHLEDDETRPTRKAMKQAYAEAYRVLKPGGMVIMSTRNKNPTYDSHYWYAGFCPEAVAKMTERVPSREQCIAAQSTAGFVVGNVICPQLATFMKSNMYNDPSRIADPTWQRGDSFWSLVSDEEKAGVHAIVEEMTAAGTMEAHLKSHEVTRTMTGQVLFITGSKPIA